MIVMEAHLKQGMVVQSLNDLFDETHNYIKKINNFG